VIWARGPQRFAAAVAEAGAAGVIVPDLPPEEGGEVAAELRAAGLDLVQLVAPTTPAERRARICAVAEGFVYVVSDTRTTGERESLPPALGELIEATRADAEVPVAVGFGIGTPQQVAEVGRAADGVIVGSRLVRAVEEADGPQRAAVAVGDFIGAARVALAS
jgi:tryptophan synthase alpha chain